MAGLDFSFQGEALSSLSLSKAWRGCLSEVLAEPISEPPTAHRRLHHFLCQFLLTLKCQHHAKSLSMHYLVVSSLQLYEISAIVSPILQVDKLRLRKVY